MPSRPERLAIPPSKKKLAGLILGSAAFVGACAYRVNVGMVGSAINISTNGLAISLEELARQLDVFVAAYGRSGG